MKFFGSVLVLALAADVTMASSWFGKSAYNNMHKTELERWLSDHDIPYPSPADRKDLEKIVKDNWSAKVSTPYTDWDIGRLQQYLKDRGYEATDSAAETKEGLLSRVKANWHESEDQTHEKYASVKDYIFSTWSDSQLLAFLDKHNIPAPHPRTRDNLLATARNNYESAAKKAGETSIWPGNWLYSTWSESDLKAFLDYHGIPAPQPSSRDKLIASVRRNAYLASKGKGVTASATSAVGAAAASATSVVKGAASSGSSAIKGAASGVKDGAESATSVVKGAAEGAASSVKSGASAASSGVGSTKDRVNEAVFDQWSDSQIKAWADKRGIKVPQGSTRNELIALARKNVKHLKPEDVTGSAASAYGAATSKVGNTAAQVTDDVKMKVDDLFNQAIGTWSDSRLKEYLDSRGVPVPQSGKRDEMLAAVRLNRHKAATAGGAWTFDTWTTENLRSWLAANGDKSAKKAAAKSGAARADLLKYARDSYASASKTGGSGFASVTSAMAAATGYVKDSTFDTWTSSDLKAYLDSYGVPVPQGTKEEELKAMARKQSTYFRYGTSSPSGTLLAKLQSGAQWILEQLKFGAASGRKEGQKAYDYATEKGTEATHRAQEAAQRASDRAKEEL